MAELAGRQHGVVSRDQALELGLSRRQIECAIDRGELKSLFRGVYLLGPFEAPRAREQAAVLACGSGACASHRTAAQLHKLLPHPARRSAVDVTVTQRNAGIHPGIRLHRTVKMEPGEIETLDGISITAPDRTLIDLGSCTTAYELESAVAEAFALGLTNRSRLLRAVNEAGRKRGVASLRRMLVEGHGPQRTRSGPERQLLTLIRGADLPEPETNAKIGPWEVDFYWREYGLVVEVDAYSTHSSPWAFERDRRKDAWLAERGLTVRRETRNEIRSRPELVVARIRRNLRRLTR